MKIFRAPLKMHFFRDCGVSAVLEDPKQLRWGQLSSCTPCTLRFCARRFLALTKKSLFLEVPFSLLLLLTSTPLCLATETIGLPPPDAPLSLLVYKMEVLNYCGLIDDEISKGFKRQRDHLIVSLNLTPEDVQNARMEGWKFGLAEWQNRGLGGFRNWCKTEGKDIVDYFHNIRTTNDSSPALQG